MNKEELKRYINRNIDLIDSEDWQDVFPPYIFDYITSAQVRELVEMLKSSGVVIPAEKVFSRYDEFYEDDSRDVYDHANSYIGSRVNEEFNDFNGYRVDQIIKAMESSQYYADHDEMAGGEEYPEKSIIQIIIQEDYSPDFSIECYQCYSDLVKGYFYNSDIIKYVNIIPGIGFGFSLSGIQKIKDQIIADIMNGLNR